MVAVQCGPIFLEEKITILTWYDVDDYIKVVGISEEQKEWLMLMYSNPYNMLRNDTHQKSERIIFSMKRDIELEKE